MSKEGIAFSCFPRTLPPPHFVSELCNVVSSHDACINTDRLEKGLTSNEVMATLRDDLISLGFEVEGGKKSDLKIKRPVFYGERGEPTLKYEIDAYHPGWKCGLEIEAGRAWMGNAVYRDLVQAMVMIEVDHLVLMVPTSYKYNNGGRCVSSRDYESTCSVAEALYGHTRLKMPYSLIVIGY